MQTPRGWEHLLWLGTVWGRGRQGLSESGISGEGRDTELPLAGQPSRGAGCGGEARGVGEVRTLFGFGKKKRGESSPFPAGGLLKFPTVEFILED